LPSDAAAGTLRPAPTAGSTAKLGHSLRCAAPSQMACGSPSPALKVVSAVRVQSHRAISTGRTADTLTPRRERQLCLLEAAEQPERRRSGAAPANVERCILEAAAPPHSARSQRASLAAGAAISSGCDTGARCAGAHFLHSSAMLDGGVQLEALAGVMLHGRSRRASASMPTRRTRNRDPRPRPLSCLCPLANAAPTSCRALPWSLDLALG